MLIKYNNLNEDIVSAVRQGIDEVCPKIAPRRKDQPWKDAELEGMLKDLQKLNKVEDVRKMQKEIKKKRMELKNKYYKDIAENINSAAQAREVEKEFAMMKKALCIKNKTRQIIFFNKACLYSSILLFSCISELALRALVA